MACNRVLTGLVLMQLALIMSEWDRILSESQLAHILAGPSQPSVLAGESTPTSLPLLPLC